MVRENRFWNGKKKKKKTMTTSIQDRRRNGGRGDPARLYLYNSRMGPVSRRGIKNDKNITTRRW